MEKLKLLPILFSSTLIVSSLFLGTHKSQATEGESESLKDKLIEQYKIGEIQTTPDGQEFVITGIEVDGVKVGNTDGNLMNNGDIYNADGSKVSKEEHQKELNEIKKFKAIQEKTLESKSETIKNKNMAITPASTYRSWKYTEAYNGISLNGAKTKEVTNPLKCPTASTGCSLTVSVSGTNTHSFAGNVVYDLEKAAIKLGATYTWVTSATTSQSYTVGIPKGKTGWVVFTPKQHWTVGTSKEYLVNAESGYKTLLTTHSNITSYSAMKLPDGQAAGYFEGKTN